MNRTVYKTLGSSVIAAAVLGIASAAKAQTSITLYPNLSPVRVPGTSLGSPNGAQYRVNVLTGVSTGQPNVGGNQANDPAAFNTIGQPITNGEASLELGLWDMVGLPFNTWRGKHYASGPFANEYGTFFRTSLHVESNTPFTSEDVKGGVREEFYQEDFTLTAILAPGLYTAISWGDDQKRGTPDDIVYGSAPLSPDTLVNEISTTGSGWMFYYLPDPSMTPQEIMNEHRRYINTDYNGRYEGRIFYTLQDQTSGVTIAASVPDSGPLGVAAAGVLLGMIRLGNRRKV